MGTWWVPSRIEATVTREFVLSHLLPDEIERLDQPVAFGDEELTERTYWDSIRDSAKRLFLILVDLGVPDQIFGVIDDGWDDDELPVPQQDVDRLQLTAARDERVERKFYQRQFHYLLKTIEPGEHQIYSGQDVVPVSVVDRSSGLIASRENPIDRVKLPNAPGRIFCRRRFSLGTGRGSISPPEFFESVQSMKVVQNDHIVSCWASYTHDGYGYVLLTPSSDFTLKSFLSTPPPCFKNLPKKERREMVVNWILCLVDTLCFLHGKDRSHGLIKPSTILLNHQNHVFYSYSNNLSLEGLLSASNRSSFDRERYDYAAPEQWYRPTGTTSPPPRNSTALSHQIASSSSLTLPRAFDMASTPSSMLHAPNPQLDPQHADIFSLACIILELLSFLVKKSTGKFATFRSAKHKTAGRGGAVLDTSFHKNLGQVEEWMSRLAKEASKKVSSVDGGQVYKGVAPMLRVVTKMLSANPHDRPSALEVQQQIYRILVEDCEIKEPHCVHQYTPSLDHALSRIHLQSHGESSPRPINRASLGYSSPRSPRDGHLGSVGGYSQYSTGTSASSEAEFSLAYSATRGMSLSQRMRQPTTWSEDETLCQSTQRGSEASLYTLAQ